VDVVEVLGVGEGVGVGVGEGVLEVTGMQVVGRIPTTALEPVHHRPSQKYHCGPVVKSRPAWSGDSDAS
jgi:hypothetical protein